MTSVSLIESPAPDILHPVENCIRLCFRFNEVFTAGSPASAAAFFTENVPFSQGDTFIFAGVEFTVGQNPGEVNLIDNDHIIQAENFIEAIQNHPKFSGRVSGSITPGSVSAFATINWLEVGAQENFTFDCSNMNPPDVMCSTAGSGIDPIYVKGFEFIYQALCVNADGSKSLICPIQNSPYITDQATGEVLDDCIEFDFSNQVKTTIPDCEAGIVNDTTIQKTIEVKYGHVTAKQDCGVNFFPLNVVPHFTIWNGAFNLEEGEDPMFHFVTGIDIGDNWLNVVRFLRSGPQTRKICPEACDWLWIHLNGKTFAPVLDQYVVDYIFKDEAGNTIFFGNETVAADNGTIIIPSGPANISNVVSGAIPWDNISHYSIQLKSVQPILQNYSEQVVYQVCTCPKYSIYFLDTKGGYNRLDFEKVEAIEITETYREICMESPCGGEYKEKLMGGKQRFASQVNERTILQSTKFKKTPEFERLLRAFKASDSKFVLHTDDEGNTNPKRILIEPGSTRIFQQDGSLNVSLVVLNAHEYLKPSEA